MDLALPTDVPVAELVATLTERLAGPRTGVGPTGGPGSRRQPPRVWRLSTATGAQLPSEATLAGLGVLDGDLLRLGPLTPPPPAPVFDDPVDAIAHAGPPDPGRPSGGPPLPARAAAAGAAGAVIAAAVALAASRGGSPDPSPAAALAALAAVAALVGAGLLVRSGNPTLAASAGAGALPLAAAAAWTGLPGEPGGAHLLAGCAVAGMAAAVLLAIARTALVALVGAITAAALGCAGLAAAALVPLPPGTVAPGIAAATAAVALAVVPLLPRVAGRLAGLPVPVVPGNAAELVAAEERPAVERPDELAERALLARRYLAGLVAGATMVAASGAALAGLDAGWAGPAFAAVTVAVMLLRARGYAERPVVLVLLASAIGTAAAVVGATVATADGSGRLLIGLLLLGVAGAVPVLVVSAATRQPSPVLSRALDILEALLMATAFPLALAVLDVYRLVRQL